MKYMEEYSTQKSTTLSAHRCENAVSSAWTQAQKTNLTCIFIEKQIREWTNIQQDNFLWCLRENKKRWDSGKTTNQSTASLIFESRERYKTTQNRRFKYNNTVAEHCGHRIWW